MAAQLLDGKAMSEELRADIARKVAALKERGVTPGHVSYTHLRAHDT